jgi:hypothetical protein
VPRRRGRARAARKSPPGEQLARRGWLRRCARAAGVTARAAAPVCTFRAPDGPTPHARHRAACARCPNHPPARCPGRGPTAAHAEGIKGSSRAFQGPGARLPRGDRPGRRDPCLLPAFPPRPAPLRAPARRQQRLRRARRPRTPRERRPERRAHARRRADRAGPAARPGAAARSRGPRRRPAWWQDVYLPRAHRGAGAYQAHGHDDHAA